MFTRWQEHHASQDQTHLNAVRISVDCQLWWLPVVLNQLVSVLHIRLKSAPMTNVLSGQRVIWRSNEKRRGWTTCGPYMLGKSVLSIDMLIIIALCSRSVIVLLFRIMADQVSVREMWWNKYMGCVFDIWVSHTKTMFACWSFRCLNNYRKWKLYLSNSLWEAEWMDSARLTLDGVLGGEAASVQHSGRRRAELGCSLSPAMLNELSEAMSFASRLTTLISSLMAMDFLSSLYSRKREDAKQNNS